MFLLVKYFLLLFLNYNSVRFRSDKNLNRLIIKIKNSKLNLFLRLNSFGPKVYFETKVQEK